ATGRDRVNGERRVLTGADGRLDDVALFESGQVLLGDTNERTYLVASLALFFVERAAGGANRCRRLAFVGERLRGKPPDGELSRAHQAERATLVIVERQQRIARQRQHGRVAGQERVAQRFVGQPVEDRRRAHLAPSSAVDGRLRPARRCLRRRDRLR